MPAEDIRKEIPYVPEKWESRDQYEEQMTHIQRHRDKEFVLHEASRKDPTVRIHVWPTVVHPTHEERTAWLRPANAYTQILFNFIPGNTHPPHELIASEKKQRIPMEPYIESALFVDGPRPDDPDFPERVKTFIQSTFQSPNSPDIELIIHNNIVILDRDPNRNASGVEPIKI